MLNSSIRCVADMPVCVGIYVFRGEAHENARKKLKKIVRAVAAFKFVAWPDGLH